MQKHAIFKPEGKTVFFDSTITLQNDTANLNPKEVLLGENFLCWEAQWKKELTGEI